MKIYTLILIFFIAACAPSLPNPANITPATAQPTPNATNVAELCAIANLRAQDWAATIAALENLQQQNQYCGTDETLEAQLYSAYLGYGTELEQQGNQDGAIRAYEHALAYNSAGTAAQNRLAMLQQGNTTSQTLQICPETILAQFQEGLEAYQATSGTFVTMNDQSLLLDGNRYPVYGANYYPRDTPFALFLAQESGSITEELILLQEAGMNTLRIFLYYDTLFTCSGNGLVPIAAHFQRLDEFIHMASEYGLRLILVLHHAPDLTHHPLYENQPHIQEQTQFIIERYRDEPTILAWDVRDRGDQDYIDGAFERSTVLAWLAETIRMIRTLDRKHLITAGWWQDALVTAPLVDFVSFQAFGEYTGLRQEIANLRASASKPILLSAVGYSTFELDETIQRNLLYQALEETHQNDLLGWVVFMAFDYPRTTTCIPPDCPGTGRPIDHFGLWNTSYFPKLSVEAIEVITGVADE